MKVSYPDTIIAFILMFAASLDTSDAARRQCPKPTITNGRARIRARGRMARFSCNKGNTLVGFGTALCLRNGSWSRKLPVCVGLKCPPPEVEQNVTVKHLHGGAMLSFQCDVGLTRLGPETLKCIGNKWDNAPPKCLSLKNLNCDFEDPFMCGWNNDLTDDFDWTWTSGSTPTAGTGPSFDHTTKTDKGHYVFIETSSPQKTGDKARLLSPVFTPENLKDKCFGFFYHMYGNNVGKLELSVRRHGPIGDLGQTTILSSISGNQGNMWKEQHVVVPYTKPVQFVFEATRSNSWSSDIALDDFHMYECPNGPTQKAPTPLSTTPGITTQPPRTTTRKSTTISLSPTVYTYNFTRNTHPASITTLKSTVKPRTTTTTTTTTPTITSTTSTTTSTTPTTTTTHAPSTTTKITTTLTTFTQTPTTATTTTTTAYKPSTTTTTQSTPTTTTPSTTQRPKTPTVKSSTSTGATTELRNQRTESTSYFQSTTLLTTVSTHQPKTTPPNQTLTTRLENFPSSSSFTTPLNGRYTTAKPIIKSATTDNKHSSYTTVRFPNTETNNRFDTRFSFSNTSADDPLLNAGHARSSHGNSEDNDFMGKIPFILGVVGGVLVVASVISLIAFVASRRHRGKQRARGEEDRMNIMEFERF